MTTQAKADFWKEYISAWQISDLSQAAYFKQHDLKLSTFTCWRNEQNKPDSS